jgi:hypothetical protein
MDEQGFIWFHGLNGPSGSHGALHSLFNVLRRAQHRSLANASTKMKLQVVALAAMLAQASASSTSSSAASSSGLNGWYPCSESTFSDEGGSENQDAECAVFAAPLCYPGVCDAPEAVGSTVDIFVKRVAALSDSETATNVWIMQGGPGASSTASTSLICSVLGLESFALC